MRNAERTVHPIPPEYDSQSRILILGSFPSVRSRADGFFYAHPGNRFWRIMEALYSVSLPDIPSRKLFLHDNHIALWDTVASCMIECEIKSPSKTRRTTAAGDEYRIRHHPCADYIGKLLCGCWLSLSERIKWHSQLR